MLDLDAGVHLHEVEIFTVVIEQKFDGAAVLVTDLLADADGGLTHALAQGVVHLGAWALFDDLLVTPLHGAVALAEMNDVPEAVGDDLEFDVVGLFDELLHVHRAVAEAFHGLHGRGLKAGDEGGFIEHRAHAAAAATGTGFDNDRITNFTGPMQGFLFIVNESV